MVKTPTWTIRQSVVDNSLATGNIIIWEKFNEITPFEFFDTLEFVNVHKSSTAAIFTFHSRTSGHMYQTGITGIKSMMLHLVNGVITGTFGFYKQHSTVYLKLVKVHNPMSIQPP